MKSINQVIKIGSDNSLPRGYWEWLLSVFIIGSLTLSYIEGLSKIIILYGILFSGLFLIYFLYHRISIKVPPEIIIYFVWIVWSLGGMKNIIDESLYFHQLKTIIQIGIMIFLVSTIIAMRRNISVVILAMAVGVTILSINSIYTGEFQIATEIDSSTRAGSLIGNSNEFAYCLLFLLFAMFYFWEKYPSLLWRTILSAIISFSFIFIVLSGSRKGFLSSLVFIFLWWLFTKGKELSKKPVSVCIILLILLGGIYFITNFVMSDTLLGKRFESKEIERGSNTRIQMYKDGFNIIKNYPIFGIGLNNYRLLSSSGLYSHSDYIEVASNTGIGGFILYFSIYIVLWRRLNRIKRMTNDHRLLYIIGLLKAMILTILLFALGRPNITSKITWLFLACVIGYSWSIDQVFKMLFQHKKYLSRIEQICTK